MIGDQVLMKVHGIASRCRPRRDGLAKHIYLGEARGVGFGEKRSPFVSCRTSEDVGIGSGPPNTTRARS